MKVIKRDGTIVNFEKEKIIKAILKAFEAVDGKITDYAIKKAYNIAQYIENSQKEKAMVTVEEIQDLVEKGLMSTKRKDVGKAYILYRDSRTRVREGKSKLMSIVEDKLTARDVQNQNANVDERSFGGRKGETIDAIMKEYALNNCMSEKSKYNHVNNRIYIHDLASYPLGDTNCLTIPFDKLLAEGFSTRQVDIRPANSINTAFQLVAVIFQLQSLMQFGRKAAC